MLNMFKVIKSQPPLIDYEMQLFISLHRSHLSRMGREGREKHAISNIVSVYRDFNSNAFIVRYKNSEWYHYCLNGEVY